MMFRGADAKGSISRSAKFEMVIQQDSGTGKT
jgi:hypothetical protein